MEHLPLELLVMISEYLEIGDYINWRASCRLLRWLSATPSLHFPAYERSWERWGAKYLHRDHSSFELVPEMKVLQGRFHLRPQLPFSLIEFDWLVETELDDELLHVLPKWELALKSNSLSRYDPTRHDNYLVKIASEQGRVDIVATLLRHASVDPCADSDYALREAAAYGHAAVVQELLKNKRVDPSAKSNQAIEWAAYYGHLRVVSLLLANPRFDASIPNRAIQWASEEGKEDVVDLLLGDRRCDPAADGNYAIRWASSGGNVQIVRLLLSDPRVDPSAGGNYALKYAIENGHLDVVAMLLKDARVSVLGDTALLKMALKSNQHEISDLLFQHGARL
ncbi:hypothetical protein HDV03_003226 [Kappamyces sp. JEL0829]|nr:hypothetical protein HDV03_003226 [Kappamyces sp. JEL0829]